jgi:hypothetical protein
MCWDFASSLAAACAVAAAATILAWRRAPVVDLCWLAAFVVMRLLDALLRAELGRRRDVVFFFEAGGGGEYSDGHQHECSQWNRALTSVWLPTGHAAQLVLAHIGMRCELPRVWGVAVATLIYGLFHYHWGACSVLDAHTGRPTLAEEHRTIPFWFWAAIQVATQRPRSARSLREWVANPWLWLVVAGSLTARSRVVLCALASAAPFAQL